MAEKRDRRQVAVQRTEPVEASEEGYPVTPEPEPLDSARELVVHTRKILAKDGMSDDTIGMLARQYVANGDDPDAESFVLWARKSIGIERPRRAG